MQLDRDGTGNQATTGITLVEVSSTNNAGAYSITANSATSFIAVAGKYTLMIYDTAAPEHRWSVTYYVTSTGAGDGTAGPISFTAVSSNGRVTDGTSPLAGATVYIRDPANILYSSLTTTAVGLWGPVHFPASGGTYTVYAQKSGYAATSATIVVGPSAATGPSTDISLAPVTTGSGLALADLMSYARRAARDAVGNRSDADLKSAINDALSMVSKAHLWPHFQTHGTLSLDAAYSTGTVALTSASTTVTLTAGDWPTWAASGKLFVNGQIHRITTRDSATQLTLTTAFKAASLTGQTYVIFRDEYALASDLLKFGSILAGQTWSWGVSPISFDQYLNIQNDWTTSARSPSAYCIARGKVLLWPYPQSNVLINYWYYRRPATLATIGEEADWDDDNLEVFQRAIDYQVSIRWQNAVCGNPDQTMGRYRDALLPATSHDKTVQHRPSPLGGNRNRRTGGDLNLPSA